MKLVVEGFMVSMKITGLHWGEHSSGFSGDHTGALGEIAVRQKARRKKSKVKMSRGCG